MEKKKEASIVLREGGLEEGEKGKTSVCVTFREGGFGEKKKRKEFEGTEYRSADEECIAVGGWKGELLLAIRDGSRLRARGGWPVSWRPALEQIKRSVEFRGENCAENSCFVGRKECCGTKGAGGLRNRDLGEGGSSFIGQEGGFQRVVTHCRPKKNRGPGGQAQ